MQTVFGVDLIRTPLKNIVITLGNFDGVHLGHQCLIGTAKERAKILNTSCVVMTFEPHPLRILAPKKGIKKLFSTDDQIEQMKKLGVDYLIIEPFTVELAGLSAEMFLRSRVVTPFSPKNLVIGYDFAFGRGREGDINWLKKNSHQFGFELEVVPALKVDNEIVSSTTLRGLIESGQVAKALKFLGRPYYLRGEVVKGFQRGQKLGFPTANLNYESELVLASGVYVTRSIIDGQSFLSVTNVGINPTFKGQHLTKPLVETFIFDFNKNIYGKKLSVQFLSYLRSEVRFGSVEALREQIGNDVKAARRWFDENAN